MSEPVLAFRGERLEEGLQVYDQDANQVGITAPRKGQPRHYQLLDTDRNCLLAIEPVKRRRLSSDYLIRGPDGKVVGVVAAAAKKQPRGVWPVMVGTDVVGSLRLERSRIFSRTSPDGDRGSLVDTRGAEVARLLRTDIPPDGKYMLEIAPSAIEPLRTIAIAAAILWDLTAEVTKSGG